MTSRLTRAPRERGFKGGERTDPAYLCRAECAAGSLQRLLPAWHAKADPVHLVYPRQRFMPPKLRAFIDLAGEVLAGCLE